MLLFRIAPDIGERQNDHRQARRGGPFSRRWLRRRRLADLQRKDPYRLCDVLELGRAEIGHREIEAPLDLPVGVLGKTDRAGRCDAFEARGDIDAIAHQITVGLLDDVAEMDADAELDAAIFRQAGVALDHAILHLDRAANRADDAARLDENTVPRALEGAPMMHGNGWIDQITPQAPKPRQSAILVRAREPAVADNIGAQDRSDLPRFRHRRRLGIWRYYHEMTPPGSCIASGADGISARSYNEAQKSTRPL